MIFLKLRKHCLRINLTFCLFFFMFNTLYISLRSVCVLCSFSLTNFFLWLKKTRMTIFIKENLKKLYDQTNIDKYRVIAYNERKVGKIKINKYDQVQVDATTSLVFTYFRMCFLLLAPAVGFISNPTGALFLTLWGTP